MDAEALKRRRREPRVRDNPMALVAHDVMVKAEEKFRRAHLLAEAMEPHLLQRISESKVYSYTNDREDRNVPPGDVLLAAALAAGISLDQRLGLVPDPRDAEMNELRAQIAAMRNEMANLRAELTGRDSARDEAAARAERVAQRRAWAVRSEASKPPTGQPTPETRRPGRSGRR
jgi:hypothetical protein